MEKIPENSGYAPLLTPAQSAKDVEVWLQESLW